ncbi:N-methyl-L-tryptophan oxidase [Actinoplanes sp. CA-142083]|uniref:N-methyl-L-tryptophan oxidase n=1 Tax=Actinoplanes sp. CA-142083 TaxID=3239903 RepID=UPI003D8A4B17
MASFDVIVVGLGGMGSATALRLASRGVRVLGLERFDPAHARGASHGGSRIIRQSYFEGAEYVPLLLRSYELFEELAADAGRDVISLTGGLMIGLPESRTVAGSRASAERWGLDHEMLDAQELRRRYPTLAPQPGEVALFEAKAGFVRPEATVAANLELAARRGADLRFREPMTSWTRDGDGVRVVTAEGEHTAGHLVITPGPWAPELLADLDVPFRIERQVQFWFRPRGGVGPFRPERHPIYIWEDAGGGQIYGFPAIDGPDDGAKIAFFRRGTETTADALDTAVHDDEIAEMASYCGVRLPDLPGEFRRGEPCLYTTTPDEHFVIGRHPEHPAAVTVACGFSGHGFKFVPVVGEVVADLATTGTTAHPIGLFNPSRFAGNRPI